MQKLAGLREMQSTVSFFNVYVIISSRQIKKYFISNIFSSNFFFNFYVKYLQNFFRQSFLANIFFGNYFIFVKEGLGR